jgi:hypothetical protein
MFVAIPSNFLLTPGMDKLMSLRGLKSFKLTYVDQPPIWSFLDLVHRRIRRTPMTFQSEIDLRIEVAALEKEIDHAVTTGAKIDCVITHWEVNEGIQRAEVKPRLDAQHSINVPPEVEKEDRKALLPVQNVSLTELVTYRADTRKNSSGDIEVGSLSSSIATIHQHSLFQMAFHLRSQDGSTHCCQLSLHYQLR